MPPHLPSLRTPPTPPPKKTPQGQCISCDPLYSCPSKQGGRWFCPRFPHIARMKRLTRKPHGRPMWMACPPQHRCPCGHPLTEPHYSQRCREVPAFCSLELIQILSSKSQRPGTWGKYDFLLSTSTAADLYIGTSGPDSGSRSSLMGGLGPPHLCPRTSGGPGLRRHGQVWKDRGGTQGGRRRCGCCSAQT